MNQREHEEQRKTAMRYVAQRLRRYAKARRDEHNRRTGTETGYLLPGQAWGMYYGALRMACELALIQSHGVEYQRFEARESRISDAPITRRPFCHLKAVNS